MNVCGFKVCSSVATRSLTSRLEATRIAFCGVDSHVFAGEYGLYPFFFVATRSEYSSSLYQVVFLWFPRGKGIFFGEVYQGLFGVLGACGYNVFLIGFYGS